MKIQIGTTPLRRRRQRTTPPLTSSPAPPSTTNEDEFDILTEYLDLQLDETPPVPSTSIHLNSHFLVVPQQPSSSRRSSAPLWLELNYGGGGGEPVAGPSSASAPPIDFSMDGRETREFFLHNSFLQPFF